MYQLGDGIKFLKNAKPESIDGIFCDPPWGSGPKIQGQKTWKKILKAIDENGSRALRRGGRVLIWVGTRQLGETIKCFTKLEYKWAHFVKYIPPRYISCYESCSDPILVFSKAGEKMFYRKGKCIPQIFLKPSTGRRDTAHPCSRPIEVVRKLLHHYFKPGEIVVDPCAGSDTTGYSCRELDINYETFEIDPKMYETGIERHRQGFLFEMPLARSFRLSSGSGKE